MQTLSTPADDQTVRVLIEPGVASYPVKRQREECAAFAQGSEHLTYDDWLGMARETDTLVVASLRLLADFKRGPIKPGPVSRLRQRIARALAVGGLIVEASSGATSRDHAQWAAAVRLALAFVRSGGHMSGETARKRSKAGAKRGGDVIKARSAVERWKREPKLWKQARAMWLSPEFRGDMAKTEAVNNMLAAMDRAGMQFSSTWTARRVLVDLAKEMAKRK